MRVNQTYKRVGGWGEPVILAHRPGYQVGVVWGNEEGMRITPPGGHASAGTAEGPALRQAPRPPPQ
eukprot:5616406-Prymnesium_polylepis.1